LKQALDNADLAVCQGGLPLDEAVLSVSDVAPFFSSKRAAARFVRRCKLCAMAPPNTSQHLEQGSLNGKVSA